MCGRGLVNEEWCCKETTTCKGCNMPGRELINEEHCSKEKTACEDGNMRGGGLVNEKGCSKEKTACKGGKMHAKMHYPSYKNVFSTAEGSGEYTHTPTKGSSYSISDDDA